MKIVYYFYRCWEIFYIFKYLYYLIVYWWIFFVKLDEINLNSLDLVIVLNNWMLKVLVFY